MATWRLGIAMLGLVFFAANPSVYSEPVDTTLPQEIVSPNVEPIKPEKHQYNSGDVITYQVRVQWPKFQESARLSSPEMATENLEFLGVSQETVTEEILADEEKHVTQILNFKFATQKPGPAKINRFSLRWTLAQGAATTNFTIPESEFMVKRSASAWLKTPFLLISLGVFLFLTPVFLIMTRKKKQKVPMASPVDSLEETALKDLKETRGNGEKKDEVHNFLSRLSQILYRYLDQKLGWNPAKGSYNGVQKTIEEKWSKKDAAELKELIDQFEYLRFSEGKKDPIAAEKLYDAVSSFIERRKIS
jgi:hypothetical protein